ncbi:hypothetical protein J576_3616 [Acinetobacter sp. 766875]|nr:hypothetical protein J576_3616 [Acinetobacter sp. 766875]
MFHLAHQQKYILFQKSQALFNKINSFKIFKKLALFLLCTYGKTLSDVGNACEKYQNFSSSNDYY